MADKDEDTASSSDSVTSQETGEDEQLNFLQQLLARLSIPHTRQADEKEEKPEQLLGEVTFEGLAEFIKSEKCKNIIVMTGAGISTAAGIPDFRSPGTGLYDNLQKYNLPSPQSVFDIHYFKENPEPFFMLAKELYPGSFKPTISHYFIKLLESKGILLRNYTQNIDTLERVAGISGERLVEAHGTFHSAHCLNCRKTYSQDWVKDKIFNDKIPKCPECEGVVKPDIVFFGEALPERYFKLVHEDLPKCDMLIVMGTSLVVQPFASLIDRVPLTTPRLLINREKAANRGDIWGRLMGTGGFSFDAEDNYRDVAWLGDTDDGCTALASLLGWKDELLSLVKTAHQKIHEQNPLHKKTQPATSSYETTQEKKPALETESISSIPETTEQNESLSKDDLVRESDNDKSKQQNERDTVEVEDAKAEEVSPQHASCSSDVSGSKPSPTCTPDCTGVENDSSNADTGS